MKARRQEGRGIEQGGGRREPQMLGKLVGGLGLLLFLIKKLIFLN